jgi:hypothetical protein
MSTVDMATLTANAPTTADIKPWVFRLVRIGYAAKGLIYLLIGTLALRLALGDGGRLTDSSGALQTIVQQPFGMWMIGAIAIGVLAYAGWEITQAIADTKHKGSGAGGLMDRGLSIIKGVVYGTIGVEALRMVIGARGSSRNADDYARQAMEFPMGGMLLILIGAGIAIYGINQLSMAWKSRFDSDLNQQQLRSEGAGWVLTVGRWGIGARGVILVLVGIALARAGFAERPSEAQGMTEAMWTLFSQPYGQWLLAAVAAGLTCFGVFQLLHARYARL